MGRLVHPLCEFPFLYTKKSKVVYITRERSACQATSIFIAKWKGNLVVGHAFNIAPQLLRWPSCTCLNPHLVGETLLNRLLVCIQTINKTTIKRKVARANVFSTKKKDFRSSECRTKGNVSWQHPVYMRMCTVAASQLNLVMLSAVKFTWRRVVLCPGVHVWNCKSA
jgi:hypothetical protein